MINFPAAPDALGGWPRRLTQFLSQLLNSFQVRTGNLENRTVGAGIITLVPTNMLAVNTIPCDGTTLKQSAARALFKQIGTTFNTGSEDPDEFSVPSLTSPLAGLEYRISLGV